MPKKATAHTTATATTKTEATPPKSTPKASTTTAKKKNTTPSKRAPRKTSPKLDTPALVVPAPNLHLPRIPVTEVAPVFEGGKFPAKAVRGESFPVQATVFREGHDAYAAEAVLINPQGQETQRRLMVDIAPGLDRYETWLRPNSEGLWQFRIDTWADPYNTWCHHASVKVSAGVDVELELEEGARLLKRAAKGEALGNPQQTAPTPELAQKLRVAAAALRDKTATAQARLSAGLHSSIRHIFRTHPLRDLLGSSPSYPLLVDRERALYGSWYEIFPRSYGAWQDAAGNWHSGNLKAAAKELPRIASMGFDVVYLTPVHPIGTTFRKGRNNSLEAAPGDPGSPYGIGSPAGGHSDIHPELGTLDDFRAFVQAAKKLNLEVALDIALQCSPDHPWVQQHPDWFTARSDGSIAYAENPPKKYQDIYPLNFDNDPQGIYLAIRDMLVHWVEQGVTCFRVDNPHTKPVRFWEQLLAEFRAKYPQIIFLAEAFTKPAMMRTLAQVGFHQSYTYYTWRNSKSELEEYLHELSHISSPYMRPSFWPTTHDILTQIMVEGGETAHAMRAILAATASPTWGIYSGYEFIENVQRPGFEEQIDNEKYEFKPRDFSDTKAQPLIHLLTLLNDIRRRHPALQRLRNLKIHPTSHPSLLCFSKTVSAEESGTGECDTVIVVVNVDPHQTAGGEVYLDLGALHIQSYGDGRPCMRVRDELDGHEYHWGANNYVELCPMVRTAHIFHVQQLD